MDVLADPASLTARYADLATANARLAERRRAEEDDATAGAAAQSAEVRLQRKAAADATTYLDAQKVVFVNGIVAAEGAAAGTTVDIRV